eukprot:403374637
MLNTIDYSKQLVNLSTASANLYANGGQNVAHQKNNSFINVGNGNIQKQNNGNIRPVSAFLGAQQNAKSQAHIVAAAANQKFFRPQTAHTQQSQSTIVTARTGSASQQNLIRNGHSLRTISYSGEKSSQNAFGIDGYKIPFHGLLPREPKYTIPKDKLSNFLAQTQKRGKALPASNQYHKPPSWETKNGQFGKSANRKTFTDDAIKHSKQIPAPNIYNTEKKRKVLMGKLDRTEGFDFLSEAQYLGTLSPAPTHYKPDKIKLMKRSSSWAIMKPINEKNLGWKPVKSKESDLGSYDVAKSKTFIKSKHPVISFTKSKAIKFTTEYSNNKKHIPGSATYKYEPCFDKISIPYMKKRY